MHLSTLAYISTAALVGVGVAHMEMSDPAPVRSKHNPRSGDNVDYSMTSPLSGGGGDFPCKGSLGLLGTEQGEPVATWRAGTSYSVTISGGAPHNGGSCQISFSSDQGATFHVIHSYVGGCPTGDGATYSFSLPGNTPSTDQGLLAWSWFNNLGNREMYMNCAVIRVTGGGGGLGDRPLMFEANIGNGCRTAEGANVDFPNPGPDVTVAGAGTAPVGSCDSGPGSSGSVPSPGFPAATPPKNDPGSGKKDNGDNDGGGGGGSGRDDDNDDDDDDDDADADGDDDGHGTTGSGSGSGDGRSNSGEWTPGNTWPDWFNGTSRSRAAGWMRISAGMATMLVLLLP